MLCYFFTPWEQYPRERAAARGAAAAEGETVCGTVTRAWELQSCAITQSFLFEHIHYTIRNINLWIINIKTSIYRKSNLEKNIKP
jgi:hypothetical protein